MNPRLSTLERRRVPLPQLQSKFEGAVLDLAAAFKKTAGFKHAQTKGNERELPVREFLEQNLPASYAAVGGEIVDVRGQMSPQMDVIVYNRMKNPAFVSGASHILPAEAPLVTFEVKSTLTAEELKKSYRAAHTLKDLHPLGRPLSPVRKEGAPADDQFRYFHCVFAYSTDLAETADWEEREFKRIVAAAASEAIDVALIDRVYVADRGMIIPEKSVAVSEEIANGTALFQLFLHAMNFVLREDDRRPSVDYTNYSGGKILWKKLK